MARNEGPNLEGEDGGMFTAGMGDTMRINVESRVT